MAKRKPAVDITFTSDPRNRDVAALERIQAQLSSGGPPRDDLAERVTRLEQQLTALLVTTQPLLIRGQAVAKCGCRKLSTRSVVWTHPSIGSRTFELCDDCEPDHPLVSHPSSRVERSTRFTPDEMSRIRSLNQALQCVPSL